MSHHLEDTRVIAEDAPQYNATLVRREDHSAELASFWVKLDGEPAPFEAGQYMTAGVFADGKLWQRPYSVASAPSVAGTVRDMIAGWPVKPRIVVDDSEKYAAFRAARAALTASGTVALELAFSRTPAIVAYRIPKIEEFFARRLIQVSMVSLPNLIIGEKAYPEYLQDEANGPLLAARLAEIIEDGPERRRQLAALGLLRERIAIAEGQKPSERAAQAICELVAAT